MDKLDKEIKMDRKENNSRIKVKCSNCNHIEEFNDLAAWSFIILKSTKCKKCNATITHDNVIDG